MNDVASPSGERNWKRISMVLAGLLAVSLVVCVLLAVSRSHSQGRVDAEREATRAAERVVTNWLTYDYRTLDDISWIKRSGTPKFAKEFSSPAIIKMRQRVIESGKGISRGRVVNSAATAKDADDAKVLIFTDQTLTDAKIRAAGTAPLHARSGVELTMVRVNGRWLVDDLVQLQFQ